LLNLNGGVPMSTLKIPESMRAQDAATSGGMAFLVGELEKRDPKLREPLTSVTYQRDIVIKTGGGFVENVSAYNVSYATAAGVTGGIIGGETNSIPIMQADIGKDIFKVFTWAHVLKVPYIDQQKLQNIGRSLDDLLDKGIRLNFNKMMDQNVYLGFTQYGTYGITNNPSVTTASAVNGASGSPLWANKTPDEILADINTAMGNTWAAAEYDLSGMANHILIPPKKYQMLVQTKISTAGNISILQFLLENNIGKNQGVELFIAPSRWCIGSLNGGVGAGTGGTDRMVAYANDEDRLQVDITVPLMRALTQPDAKEFAYLTDYCGQVGQVKFLFLQPVAYTDGI
jgi:hypothetical protein